MPSATCCLRFIALPFISLALLTASPAAVTQNNNYGTNGSACERELKKLDQHRWGEKIRSPWRARYVSPTYPHIPEGTTGGGPWIGEVLIDARGRVSHVWTLRDVKLTPPLRSVTKAIVDAAMKWEFAPAAVDDVPVAVCQTVAVNVNLKAIRSGRGTAKR